MIGPSGPPALPLDLIHGLAVHSPGLTLASLTSRSLHVLSQLQNKAPEALEFPHDPSASMLMMQPSHKVHSLPSQMLLARSACKFPSLDPKTAFPVCLPFLRQEAKSLVAQVGVDAQALVMCSCGADTASSGVSLAQSACPKSVQILFSA